MAQERATHSSVDDISTQRFSVVSMRCNHCKANLEKALTALPNVTSVEIDLVSGVVEISGNASKSEVCEVINQLGFEIV